MDKFSFCVDVGIMSSDIIWVLIFPSSEPKVFVWLPPERLAQVFLEADVVIFLLEGRLWKRQRVENETFVEPLPTLSVRI